MQEFLLTFIFCLSLTTIFSQTERALQLRKNVVAISSLGEEGFGFISGERKEELFVVTAAHVVENALEENQPIDIKFFDDYKLYKGNIIRNYPEKDIALFVVKKPSDFSWEQNCLGAAKDGDDVAFVGREAEWYVPKGQALGTIFQLNNDQIQVDITSVTVGTSGGPLINSSGIIGMIIQTDGIKATAIGLNELRSTLSEYNYFFSIALNMDIKDRDGNTYATKIMKDSKRWMTKNLNIEVSDSWCYGDKASNCDEYGRLYTFESAKEACQLLGSGWGLPTDEEWQEMVKEYGGASDDARHGGKAAYEALFGKGSSGFAAQLGGWRASKDRYNDLGGHGYYWTSTPYVSNAAWYWGFPGGAGPLYHYQDSAPGFGYSVRCIQGN
jgi:uncharacterized protein (TIGR02145 family)